MTSVDAVENSCVDTYSTSLHGAEKVVPRTCFQSGFLISPMRVGEVTEILPKKSVGSLETELR